MQRSLRDTVLSIVASALFMVGVAVVGVYLTAAPAPPASPNVPETVCLDEPLVAAAGAQLRGLAHLCFGRDGLTPSLDLEHLAEGRLYSAWLASGDMPSTAPASHCLSNQTRAGGAPTTPGRVDATVADATGRVHLTAMLRGFRTAGLTEIQLLAVDHGPATPGATPRGGTELLAWQAIWRDPTPAVTGGQDQSRLVGCASFRLRGGVETLEQE